MGLLVMGGVLAAVLQITPPHTHSLGLIDLMWRGALVSLSYLACNFRQIRSTWASEPHAESA